MLEAAPHIVQTTAVLAIVAGSIVLFVSDKMPIDGVAFLVLLALLVTGLVPKSEILDGFSNNAVITIACMLIISAGLERTGIIRLLAQRLDMLAGQGRTRLTLLLSSVCGALSTLISNTATVAVLLPVTLNMCRDRKISPSRVLMPLSFAAQFGGVCTLIGTTTNLLVNDFIVAQGYQPFTLFEFAKLGGVCFVAGLIYLIVAQQFFLKDAAPSDSQSADYRLQDYLTEMRILPESPLIGQTGEDNELVKSIEDLRVLEVIRDGKFIWAPHASHLLEGDILLVRGDVDRVMEVAHRFKLEDWAEGNLSAIHLEADDVMLVEVMVPRRSRLVGRSLGQVDFYWRYHAAVMGIRRGDETIHERMAKVKFEEGDTLLLQGHREDLQRLQEEKDFYFLQDLSALKVKKKRAVIAVMILTWLVLAIGTGFTSVLTAALVAAGGMVITGCLRLREAYESLDLRIVILLASLIPLGTAMQTSGATDLLVHNLFGLLGEYGSPVVALGAVYLVTVILTAFMSNAATAVLLSPLALVVAQQMEIDPRPFLVAITFAASTCFATPVGYQTNTMVYGPGAYKYMDFVRVGVPLNLIFFVISVTLIPMFWPF